MDFVSDAFTDGRRFRILSIVDDFTRECLALVADTSLPGLRVVRELNTLVEARGRPVSCLSDNGTELTSMAILHWSQKMHTEWHYIAPGKPQQSAFVESFNGRAAGRTPERDAVRLAPPCAASPGHLERRLQHPQTPQRHRQSDPCHLRKAQRPGSATGQGA